MLHKIGNINSIYHKSRRFSLAIKINSEATSIVSSSRCTSFSSRDSRKLSELPRRWVLDRYKPLGKVYSSTALANYRVTQLLIPTTITGMILSTLTSKKHTRNAPPSGAPTSSPNPTLLVVSTQTVSVPHLPNTHPCLLNALDAAGFRLTYTESHSNCLGLLTPSSYRTRS